MSGLLGGQASDGLPLPIQSMGTHDPRNIPFQLILYLINKILFIDNSDTQLILGIKVFYNYTKIY